MGAALWTHKRTRWWSHSLLLCTVLALLPQNSEAEIKSAKLYHDLLSSYDRNIRPVKNFSEPVLVELNMKLVFISQVNFDENWMQVRMIVDQVWTDYQLEWSPNSYDYITEIVVPSEKVWLPDIAVYNNADGNLRVIPDTVRIHRSGRVSGSANQIIKLACNLEKSRFPFDTQYCYAKFGSWTFDGHALDIKHKNQPTNNETVDNGIDLSTYSESQEWKLSETHAIRHTKYYNCCREPYIDIFFHMKLERYSASYVTSLILPWVLFTCLPLFAFILPTSSNLKVTYTVFLLLLLLSTLSVTGSSTTFPIFLMRKYYLFSTFFVALTLFCCVIILNIHSRKEENVPDWLRNISKKLAEYVFLDYPGQGQEGGSKDGKSNDIELTDARQGAKPEGQVQEQSEWEQIAHIFDRVMLGIFTSICIIGIVVILA